MCSFFKSSNNSLDEEQEDDPDMYINLYLYTQNAVNESKLIFIADVGTVESQRVVIDDSYDGSKATKFIIHGFRSKLGSDIIQRIKNAYLEQFDINVIGE